MAGRATINQFLFTLLGFQKARHRFHLFLVVIVHVVAWCLFLLLPLTFYPIRFTYSRFFYGELLGKLLPVGFFYLNYYYLLPRFFEKKKWWSYFLLVLGCLLIVSAQELLIRNNMPGGRNIRFFQGVPDHSSKDGPRMIILATGDSSHFQPPAPPGVPGPTIFGVPRPMVLMSINRSLSLFLVLLLAGGLIRLGHSFLKNQNEKRALENAHLDAEVKFLRAQINPHFLFNTLNSIYAQAHNRSEQTEHSILKLSELLRYVLYETGEEKVPLEKDILYINNYIALQRMRLSAKVEVHYTVTGTLQGHTIAPLLLISFIENAFKHGISYTQPSVITISIAVFEKTLTLMVSNPVIKSDTFAPGGVGLKNVTRRLDLLYPGKHRLLSSRQDNHYTVNLKIKLESDQLRTD